MLYQLGKSIENVTVKLENLCKREAYKWLRASGIDLATTTSAKPLTLSSSITFRRFCLAAKASPEFLAYSPDMAETQTVKPVRQKSQNGWEKNLTLNDNDDVFVTNLFRPSTEQQKKISSGTWDWVRPWVWQEWESAVSSSSCVEDLLRDAAMNTWQPRERDLGFHHPILFRPWRRPDWPVRTQSNGSCKKNVLSLTLCTRCICISILPCPLPPMRSTSWSWTWQQCKEIGR